MQRVARLSVVCLAIFVAHCGEDAAPAPECPAGEAKGEKRCVKVLASCGAAGVPADGACVDVGVPKDGCGEGFNHDGAGGCAVTLPEAPCADGQVALPGETACRPVSACGDGAWGSIPIDGTTVFVDAAYAGADADGSKDKPFATIAAALAKASIGAVVAVAAGRYRENLALPRAVRLHGVCPAKTTIEGVESGKYALEIRGSGAEVHGVSVTSAWIGVGVFGATGVLLEGVRVHDTKERALDVEAPSAATSVSIRDALIERAQYIGVFVAGAQAKVERTVVRDVSPRASDGKSGHGMVVQPHASSGVAGEIEVTRSIVTRATGVGVSVIASKATLRDTLVHDVKPDARGLLGAGIAANALASFKELVPELQIEGCLVSGNHHAGISVDSGKATITRTVVRDGKPRPSDDHFGVGVLATDDAVLVLGDSLVASNEYAGVLMGAATATIERSIVRATKPRALDGTRGMGVVATVRGGKRSTLTMRRSLVAENRYGGVTFIGSTGSLTEVEVRDTKSEVATGAFGDGVVISADAMSGLDADVTIDRCLITQNARGGVNLAGAAVAVGGSTLTCNAFDLSVSETIRAGDPPLTKPFRLDAPDDSICGCDRSTACRAMVTSFAPVTAPDLP